MESQRGSVTGKASFVGLPSNRFACTFSFVAQMAIPPEVKPFARIVPSASQACGAKFAAGRGPGAPKAVICDVRSMRAALRAEIDTNHQENSAACTVRAFSRTYEPSGDHRQRSIPKADRLKRGPAVLPRIRQCPGPECRTRPRRRFLYALVPSEGMRSSGYQANSVPNSRQRALSDCAPKDPIHILRS